MSKFIRHAAIAAAVAFAGASFADEAMTGEDSGSFLLSQQAWTSALTRAEVIAQMKSERDRAEATALLGEDSGSFHFAAKTPAEAPVIVASE